VGPRDLRCLGNKDTEYYGNFMTRLYRNYLLVQLKGKALTLVQDNLGIERHYFCLLVGRSNLMK
jgi:hypothetical protein